MTVPAAPRRGRPGPDDPRCPAILAAHRRAVDEGSPGYVDPATGLYVLTEATLCDRAECCGSGCRHCPFPK